MHTYVFLFEISIILLFTKSFGLLSRRFHLPQVLGALLGGVIIGPSILGLVKESVFLSQISEIGVILLMFIAGMETDVKMMKMSGKPSIVIAALGVIVPMLGGLGLGYVFKIGSSIMESLFLGVILSATSVSITVETLREMGKLNTRVSDSLLTASILDDIIGVILLSFVSINTQSNEGIGIWWTIGKIGIFFILSFAIWVVFSKGFKEWFSESEKGLKRYAIIAVALCLFLSFASEYFFGIANIIGAFLAGLIFSDNTKNKYLLKHTETLSDLFFAPVFFASIGLKVNFTDLSGSMIWFALALIIVAILTKFIGAGVGAKISGLSNKESVQIGCGMVSRGEVAMMVANKGISMGLLGAVYFPPIIIMVAVSTLVAPVLLKLVWKS